MGRILATTLIISAMLSPMLTFAQDPKIQHEVFLGRRFADDYAQALVAHRLDYLYSRVAQKVRAAYPQEEFFKPLDLIKQYFGEIQTAQLMREGFGAKMGVFGKIDTLTYEYSVTTTKKNLKGLFLQILIDRVDRSHGLVAYHVGMHMGNGMSPMSARGR